MLSENVARIEPGFLTLPKTKVYSYARWSTPEQAKGDSNRRQMEAAAKWAAKHGYELDLSLKIVDEGRSAYRGGNAEGDAGLSRFLEACRAGLIEPGSFLLVESLDRISRMAPRRAQRLIDDIVDAGVTIVTLNDDQHYTAERLDNDPTALLIALMVAWRAHEESKTKGRRVAEAWAEKRRRVRANPAERLTCRGPSWLIPTPEGGWREHPVKADIVRRIYALTLAGEGENMIAARFNREGVPVLSNGKRWHRSSVAKVLRNPAVIGTLTPGQIRYIDGQRHHVKEAPVPNAFPAVVSEADWLAVRALKDGKAGAQRGRHASKPVAHVLAGLTKCPLCGGTMTRVYKGNAAKAGAPKLVCAAAKTKAGCRYVSVPVPIVEEAFFNGWGALFANVPADDSSGDLDRLHADLQGAIWGTEDHLADLSEAMKRTPSATTGRMIAKADEELRTMRRELEELEERRRMADRGLIHARLDGLHALLAPEHGESDEVAELDRPAINAALKVLFRAVTVDYRTGFLRFHWRQGGEASVNYSWPSETAN